MINSVSDKKPNADIEIFGENLFSLLDSGTRLRPEQRTKAKT